MRISYPTGMLTNLARAFADPSNRNDSLKTQAYMAATGANIEKDRASADYYRAKTAEETARQQARSPEALQTAVLAGMGMSPAAQPSMDLAEAFRTGRNPMTPAQPAVELPSVSSSPVGNFDLASVISNPSMALETLAPALPAQERPVDQAQLGEYARRIGDFLGMNAATGDTNYHQLQQGAGQRMENSILQKAVAGQPLTPQDLAILKASSIYNTQGINNYDGSGGQAFDVDQGNAMERERIQSGDRRYNADVDSRTSRANNADDNAAAMTRHTTPGATKGDAKADADEAEAINSLDLTLPIVPQVPKSDPDYQQFYRIYTNAKQKGDHRTLRALVHKAVKNGIIQQGE